MPLRLLVRNFWVLCVAAWAASGPPARALEAIDRASLTNFDRRIPAAPGGARPDQRRAQTALKARLPAAQTDFDPLIGSPKWIHAQGALLTGPNGEGGAVTAAQARRFNRDADQPVKAFLEEHRALFRHGAEALEGATRQRDHTNAHGLRTVAWEQQVDGIPVFDSVLVAHTTARGELIGLSSLFVPEPAAAADRGTRNRAAKAAAPTITSAQALRRAATNVGESVTNLVPVVGTKFAPKTLRQKFSAHPLPGPAEAGLVWLPLDGNGLRLCWDVELTRREFGERFKLLVDAETGEILVRRKLTVEVSEVHYRVHTSDSPSPFSPGWPVPTNTQPPTVPRPLLAISNISASASPLGWINDGVFELTGNNADARLDRNSDDRADQPRLQAGTNEWGQRVFDFPMDLALNPTNYSAAATVQLFYWCNWAHDMLYDLGFTESAGNFQKDNFGRGGADNDIILADAQDGSGFNNANFSPARDGSPAKIQMYLFNGPTPHRDGDFDADVVLHEYAHGLTDRMVGGGVGLDYFGHIQTGGLAEGWSDFYALALLAQLEDDLGGNYAMGGYITYLFNGLTQNYYYGIRRYPYSTNLNFDPLTFKDIDPNQASSHPGVPRSPIVTSGASEVHRQGEVWCSMLWDMRANLLGKYAPTNGADYTNANMKVLGYITLGLQFTPPNPSFVQARDSILAAVRNTPGSGNDTNEVWAAFARRGLGKSALGPDSTTTFGIIEAYDTPAQPEFDVLPRLSTITLTGPVGGPFTPAGWTNLLVNLSATNLAWGAGVSQSWLQLSESNGVITPGGLQTNNVFLSSSATTLSAGVRQAVVSYTNLARTQVISTLVTLNVLSGDPDPDTLEITPATTLFLQGLPGGPFSPAQQNYTLANTGLDPIGWRAASSVKWLTLSATNGVLSPDAALTNITVSVNFNANSLTTGYSYGTLSFINTNTGGQTDLGVSLRISAADYLTEDFNLNTFDLAYSTISFTPDLSTNFYRACREPATQFPVDPAGGTLLSLADDEYQQVALTNGRTVSLFGTPTNALWIGANGNLSFDPGALTNFFTPGLSEYFNAGRAAALYVDLNPATGGTISYRQLADRFVVSYENVPEFGTTNSNEAQIELFYDGAVRMTWLRIEATNGQQIISGMSRGGGFPGDYIRSDLSAASGCFPLATLVVPARATEGDGSLQATLLLGSPLTNDLIVTLSSSDPNELTVPAELLLLTGQSSVQFPIDAIDDFTADGTQPATITAAFPDRPPATASLLVDDAQSASLTINLAANGTEGTVLAGAGTVTSSVQAVRPLLVSLHSVNPNRVAVPSAVIIPAGQSSASFNLVLVDNNLLDGTENVIIEASVSNWSGDLDLIRVSDNESRALSLTLPAFVTEGDGTLTNLGRVSLGGLSVSNVVIALQSEVPGLIGVPAFVTNSAGQSNVLFNLLIGDNAIIGGPSIIRIFASALGFLNATGSLDVVDDERPFEVSNPIPEDQSTGVQRDLPLTWEPDPHAPPQTLYEIYFSTNAILTPGDLIASTFNHEVYLARELDPETTHYWQVVSRLAPFPDVASPVWQFTTVSFGLRFDPIGTTQFMNQPFPVVITAQDHYGVIVTNYTGQLTLTNSAPVKDTATIVITEIDPSSFARVEFVNVSGRPINITGWQIALYDGVRWPNPTVVYTVPAPGLVGSNDLFSLRGLPFQFFPGQYPTYATGTNLGWNFNAQNNQVAVVLRDGAGNVVDFFCAAGADPAQITAPAPVPAPEWTSPPLGVNINPARTYQRSGNHDYNSTNDWAIAPRTILTNNPGLVAPFTNRVSLAMTVAPWSAFLHGTSTSTVTVLEPAWALRLGASDAYGHGGLADLMDVTAADDLALSGSAPDSVLINQNITNRFTITNTGPSDAAGVRLTDQLAPAAAFVAATTSQGDCVFSNGLLVCELGTIVLGTNAEVSVISTASLRGSLTNIATVTRLTGDPYPQNNSLTQRTAVVFPQISIFSATNSEGNTSAVTMTFSLRLSAPHALTTSVAWATSDGVALAGLDYVATNGLAFIPPGATSATVAVAILGDVLNEANETLFINLFDATNADIFRSTATGTISDNDPLPQLFISDAAVTERDGETTNATFSVRLSAVSGRSVTANYVTANGTALAGLDYLEGYGTLTFPPGVTNQTVIVPVLGDQIQEPAKTFSVTITSAGSASIADGQGVCTLTDNDIDPLGQFSFSPLPATNYAGRPMLVSITARDGGGAVATGFNGPVSLFAAETPRLITTTTTTTNLTTWNFPLAAAFHDARLQAIYPAAEIGATGRIASIALDLTQAPVQTLSNWTIRLRHFTGDRYNVALWESSGWVTNFQQALSIISTGWVTFTFPTPFAYNGRDSLMVDFSFDNSSFSADALCRSTATTALRSLSLRTDSAFGRPLDWSGVSPAGGALTARVPRLRLGLERALTVTPPLLGNFINGVWAGSVLIDTAANELVLRAVDELGRAGQSSPAALIHLSLTRILRSGQEVTMQFPTLNGSQYVVEGSATVSDGWSPVSPVLTGDGGLLDFTLTPGDEQFFRVRIVP